MSWPQGQGHKGQIKSLNLWSEFQKILYAMTSTKIQCDNTWSEGHDIEVKVVQVKGQIKKVIKNCLVGCGILVFRGPWCFWQQHVSSIKGELLQHWWVTWQLKSLNKHFRMSYVPFLHRFLNQRYYFASQANQHWCLTSNKFIKHLHHCHKIIYQTYTWWWFIASKTCLV